MSALDFENLAQTHRLGTPESYRFAQWLDAEDPIAFIRDEFVQPSAECIAEATGFTLKPTDGNGAPTITYLCGHSMGLQPRNLRQALAEGLDQWANLGVLGYMHGKIPASKADLCIVDQFAREIVGAEPDEVALTNNLSVNIHLLLTTFYRPNGTKNCIMIEENAFPSDYYTIESQIAWHGLDPSVCIIQLRPRPNEWCLRTEDVVQAIRQNASRLALIWLSGIQYITGQFFNMAEITRAGHEIAKCPVGWDLAHVVGNVPLELHKWDVDIAVWCSYKYLNASPGGVGGLFVHARNHHVTGAHGPSSSSVQQNGPKLTGWWSHREETRFDMTSQMELAPGAAAYRVSNPPWLAMIALRTSLDIFHRCGGMRAVRSKSIRLTGYLDYLLRSSSIKLPASLASIVTPSNPEERGAQLTIWFKQKVDQYHRELTCHGFVCDIRRPNCIRVSPNAMYTRFVDVWNFAQCLHSLINKFEYAGSGC